MISITTFFMFQPYLYTNYQIRSKQNMKQNPSFFSSITHYISLLLFANILLISCDFSKRIDTTAAVKELHEREVKRITPAQFTAQVDEWGSTIVKKLNADLSKNLQDTTLKDSLAKAYRVEIVSGSPLQLKNPAWDKKINETLDAYQYNVEHNIPQIDNIQKSEDEAFFYYTSPIMANKSLLKLDKKQLNAIGEKAKMDSLAFKKDGSFLGLWVIKFSKKEVVRLADPKHLKILSEK